MLLAGDGLLWGGATEKTSDESTAVQSVQQDSLQASSDSLKVDGTTGATQVANAPSFNGILMIPPQQHATITLSMGGAVHSVSSFRAIMCVKTSHSDAGESGIHSLAANLARCSCAD